jgi:hypothetical protein
MHHNRALGTAQLPRHLLNGTVTNGYNVKVGIGHLRKVCAPLRATHIGNGGCTLGITSHNLPKFQSPRIRHGNGYGLRHIATTDNHNAQRLTLLIHLQKYL